MMSYFGRSNQYSYDSNGNFAGTRIAGCLACASTSYQWDARNRLLEIDAGTYYPPHVVGKFSYDAFGRRISKTDGSGNTTTYLYDGDNPIQETQGSTVTTLLTGLGIDERYARDDAAYGRTYFLTDALGSTLALTDTTGAVKQTYAYEPYGEVAATGTSNNPYQYTGRENDGTGLYYYRARYYSPTLKRFISEDPMGLAAGLNEYAYINGSPTNGNDPMGLESPSHACGGGPGTYAWATCADLPPPPPPLPSCAYYNQRCNDSCGTSTYYCRTAPFFCNNTPEIGSWTGCVRQCLQDADRNVCKTPAGSGADTSCTTGAHEYCFTHCAFN